MGGAAAMLLERGPSERRERSSIEGGGRSRRTVPREVSVTRRLDATEPRTEAERAPEPLAPLRGRPLVADPMDAGSARRMSNAPPGPLAEPPPPTSREDALAKPPAAAAGPAELEPATEDEPPPPDPAPRERRIELTALRRWQQPGLCAAADEASSAHARLIAHFRELDWGGARLLVDPRLPVGGEAALVAQLERAERETARRLSLRAQRPEVFAYADTQLLLAAACTNAEVVAYYDGALHVVPSDADVEQSVLHEYAHHVLMAAGVVGPAWAQEGIAMHVAGETWWQEPRWLRRLSDDYFSLDDMDSVVPYTLRADQAVLFYAQSAAMVACASEVEANGLAGLVSALRAGSDGRELSYDLPAAVAPSSWRACLGTLMP